MKITMKNFMTMLLFYTAPVLALPTARDAELSGLPPWLYWVLVLIIVLIFTALRNNGKIK